MEPTGQLMKEHRLIERMIKLMTFELNRISSGNAVNAQFIQSVVDFIRTYADRCHHGKEEDILFRKLTDKQLSPGHVEAMTQLIREHAHARRITAQLAAANDGYKKGDKAALSVISKTLEELVDFYPTHIEKEDKQFFPTCMTYLTDEEKREMHEQFLEFDRTMIHELYGNLVKRCKEDLKPKMTIA